MRGTSESASHYQYSITKETILGDPLTLHPTLEASIRQPMSNI